MKRVAWIMLTSLLLAGPAFAGNEVQAPLFPDEIRAPGHHDTPQAPRSIQPF